MRNAETWAPTKFALSESTLTASSDTRYVAPSSRLNVELLGKALHVALLKHAKGRLIDLGCGAVPLYGLYAPLVDSVTCVDWPGSAHGNNHVDVCADLGEALPFADHSFETILLTDVLEHIPDPLELLKEIRRILCPGGHMIVSVPFLYWLHEEPHDYYRYTEHGLRRLAGRAGLRVVDLWRYGSGTDVLFDVAGKISVDIHWRIGPALAAAMNRAGLWFRKTRMGSRLNAGLSAMPLGYLMVAKGVE